MNDFWLHFDGACEPKNPGGSMGMGVLILAAEGREAYRASGMVAAYPGASNNVAEYLALEVGLDWLDRRGYRGSSVVVRGDSALVINQCLGKWRVRAGLYHVDALRIHDKVKRFAAIDFEWVPREQNAGADELSKAALIEAGIRIVSR
jgi:ribonuclease HI